MHTTTLSLIFRAKLIFPLLVCCLFGLHAAESTPLADVDVVIVIESSWPGGGGGKLRITNNGTAAITAWKLECDTDLQVDGVWAFVYTQSAEQLTISHTSWAPNINAGQTIESGISLTGSISANSFTNCTLNDSPVEPTVEGASGVGGLSAITIGSEDEDGAVYQLTVDQGVSQYELLTGGTAGSYSVISSNPSAVNATIDGGNLLIDGLQSGRAGLRVEDSDSGDVRHVGIRVRNADGTLPGMPNYVSIGSVSEDTESDLTFWGDTDSDLTNKRMDVRYIYLNGGPTAGWSTWNGTITETGGRAISFIRESLKLGMIPAFVYYNIPDGAESYATDVGHMQSTSYMEGYFNDLKLALDIINREAPDETTVLIFEPDFLGYLAQKGDDPLTMMAQTSAAYSTGVLDSETDPAFPNTVRGLVEAINYAVSSTAPQVQFGWQLNLWASPPGGHTVGVPGDGLIHLTDTMGIADGRQAIYDEAAAITQYYIDAGIGSNGAHFLSIDKYGLDAGAEGSASNPANSTWFWNNDHWTNYLQFVRAMHDTSELPIVLWQLPVGHINSSQAVNPYTGGTFPDHGNGSRNFEDSAPTYFFGDTFEASGARFDHFSANGGNDASLSTAGNMITWGDHMEEAADAGVVSILFGAGVGNSTDGVGDPPTDDYWWITQAQEYYLDPVLLGDAQPVVTSTPTPTETPVPTDTPILTATTTATNTPAPNNDPPLAIQLSEDRSSASSNGALLLLSVTLSISFVLIVQLRTRD